MDSFNDPSIIENQKSVLIKPRRVFRCNNGHFSTRKEVQKLKGEYFCRCGDKVEDITDRQTGHDLMEIINL